MQMVIIAYSDKNIGTGFEQAKKFLPIGEHSNPM
jgi:hypothetical protein